MESIPGPLAYYSKTIDFGCPTDPYTPYMTVTINYYRNMNPCREYNNNNDDTETENTTYI